MNKFKLIFNGQLLENTDRSSCIDGLAKLFDKSPEAIESKLFDGKQTVIKITTEQHVVDYYTNAFNKIGARLLVKQEFMGKGSDLNDPVARAETRKKRDALPVRTIVHKGSGKKNFKTRLLSPGNRKKLGKLLPADKKMRMVLYGIMFLAFVFICLLII